MIMLSKYVNVYDILQGCIFCLTVVIARWLIMIIVLVKKNKERIFPS